MARKKKLTPEQEQRQRISAILKEAEEARKQSEEAIKNAERVLRLYEQFNNASPEKKLSIRLIGWVEENVTKYNIPEEQILKMGPEVIKNLWWTAYN